MNGLKYFVLYSTIFLLYALRYECGGSCHNPIDRELHKGFIGPEIYHMKRTKKGGSRQTGWLYGGRALYERLRRQGWYWALRGNYASGCLTGKTASGGHLNSRVAEAEIEGRGGYSFCCSPWKLSSLTPYAGYGYLYSKNRFLATSPLPCTFHNRLHYGTIGLLSLVCFTDNLEAGFDLQAKFTVEGKSIVTDDPDYDTVTLFMKNKTQYEVNIPVRYRTCWQNCAIVVSLIPFYRFRRYGSQGNYPFNFIDTKFHLYGGKCLIHLCF
ncbi:MAG: hypothetical protein WB791_02510 [Waddliaceae bacterium]